MGRLFRRLAYVLSGAAVVIIAAGLTYGALACASRGDSGILTRQAAETEDRRVPELQQVPLKAQESPYASIAFYSPENQARYEEYRGKHTEMDWETVVRHVNIGLDRPFYEGAQVIDDVGALPLVVNKYHYLPQEYKPELITRSDGFQLAAAANEAFDAPKQDAEMSGYRLAIKTAYRSVSEQERLHASFAKTYSAQQLELRVARPGFSEHHTGYAVDIYAVNEPGAFENTKAYQWVIANSWRYGFIVRYPLGYDDITGYQYEPWHITYVGSEVAARMQQEGTRTLEEYMAEHSGN